MKLEHRRVLLAFPCVVLLVASGALQRETPQAELSATKVAGNVWLVDAPSTGGNIGVCAGADGVLLVDDKFEHTAAGVEKALAMLAKDAPRYLVNTHWHGDHTGANAHFAASATILAHENVRRRLAGDASIGGSVEEEPLAQALPVVTFEDGLSLHLNGEVIRVRHVEGAHTDGDSIVWFEKAGVVHMGDVFFQIGYPFVDVSSGGRVSGVIAAVKQTLEWLPATAKVIPGHGVVTGPEGLREYLTMLETISQRVADGLRAGKTAEAMHAAGVTKDFDPRWGGFNFIPPEKFVAIVVESLRAEGFR
jgi:glyoxylase-like metal-dependent hydrolase (beta-lactamase superfamily II)